MPSPAPRQTSPPAAKTSAAIADAEVVDVVRAGAIVLRDIHAEAVNAAPEGRPAHPHLEALARLAVDDAAVELRADAPEPLRADPHPRAEAARAAALRHAAHADACRGGVWTLRLGEDVGPERDQVRPPRVREVPEAEDVLA